MKQTHYDEEHDILSITLQEGEYWKSLELPGMIIDMTKEGAITSIEILKASQVFSGDGEKIIEKARN